MAAGSAREVGAVRCAPATAAEVAQAFKAARSDRVGEILDTLVALGQAEILTDGRYLAS